MVERSPEKAGVGGSTPSLATIIPKDLGVFAHFLQPKIQSKIRPEDRIAVAHFATASTCVVSSRSPSIT